MPKSAPRPGPFLRLPLLPFLVAFMVLGGIQGSPFRPAGAGPPGLLRAAGAAWSPVASIPVAAPAYYRPVLARGKAFPVARSNFFSLLEFPNNWHAPRLRLISGKWRLVGVHQGIDISAEPGTPVLAMEPGVVENVGWTFYSGTRVGVRGADGRYYLYAHLSSVQPRMVQGARVGAGAVLGRVGNTGYGPPGHRDEFPPHLHFSMQAGAEWINPYATLVMLYRATVEQTSRAQAALDALAAAGKRRAWTLRAARAYMSLPPP